MKDGEDPNESALLGYLKKSGDALVEGHKHLIASAEILSKKKFADLSLEEVSLILQYLTLVASVSDCLETLAPKMLGLLTSGLQTAEILPPGVDKFADQQLRALVAHMGATVKREDMN